MGQADCNIVKWGSHNGGDEDPNLLESYALFTGKYVGHSKCQGNLLYGAKNVAREKWSIHSWKYVASSCKYYYQMGVYEQEPLVGSKLRASFESRIRYFIVVHTGNMEQKIQYK